MKLEKKVWLFTLCLFLELPWASAQTTAAPTTPTPMAASAATAVPPMIPYSGTARDRPGNALTGEETVAFLIYKDEQGGEPLFTETQTVTPDPSGHYTVQLGASLSNGIPIDLFASGEARWLEVQIAGEQPQPRVLLVSVPYALKAADAATLGGLPASAYALAGTKTAASMASSAITPDGVTTVTTTGGVSGHVAEFSGASAIADSPLFVLGADVGIGTTTPTSTLDVNGTALISGTLSANGGETVNSTLELAPTGTATAAAGFSSALLKFYTSAYNSTSKAAVIPRFEWQADVTGNNTAAPSTTLNLLSSTTSASATNTGFSFNANGTINFAPGQAFPGTGKITSVGLSAPSSDFNVTGSPVTGAGTLGLNWKVAPTSADTANAIVKRDASGSFTAGAITASLGVEGVTSASTGAGVAGIHNGGGNAVSGVSLQAGGVGLYGDGTSYGVESVSGGYGVYGRGGYIGVWGESTSTTSANGDGVHGVTASGLASGVAGVNNAGGVGVYGTGGTGVFGTGSNYGFVTDSNVQQARTAGGWIKAMLEVDANSSINRCFNSTLTGAAATTPPCGIDLEHPETGVYNLNFNFEVDDRFYTTQILFDSTLALVVNRGTNNILQVLSYYAVGDLEDGLYQLIVY
jgi:hypothetical protein